MKYHVGTVYRDADDKIATREHNFASKAKAMDKAKKLAETANDCVSYGPTSLAYVGEKLTAVVSWE